MSANDDVQALAGIYWPTYEPPPEERQKMERIHQFGMEVHCTLHSEILGYNDVHSLMHDYWCVSFFFITHWRSERIHSIFSLLFLLYPRPVLKYRVT